MNLDGANYKVEAGEGLRRTLHVQIPSAVMQAEFLARLNALRRRTRIRGFRPGKAPIKLIRQRYGQGVWDELTREIIEQSFRDGARKSKLRVVGSGEVKARKAKEGSDLSYQASFDVFPEIEWQGLDELTYEEPEVEIESHDVDRTITRMRRGEAEWKDLERPARDGDRMVVNLRASRRRETLEPGELKEATLMLGETRLMAPLKERLTGLSASQKKKFRIKLPPDYPEEHLRGKRVRFEVEVLELSEPVLPDLDEEFVRKLGVESGSLVELRAHVQTTLERELRSVCDAHKRRALFDQLLEANAGPAPKSLVDHDVEQMLARMRPPPQPESEVAGDGAENGADAPEEPQETPEIRAAAERRIRLQLLLSELASREGIQPDQQALGEQLKALAATAPDPEAAFTELAGDRDVVASLRAGIREGQVLEWLYERAAVSRQNLSFDEFMEPLPPILTGQGTRK